MDRYFVHPPVLILTNNAGVRWIDFTIRNSMLDTLPLKKRQELSPDEVALLPLPLATT